MSQRRRPHGLGALLVIAIGVWVFFQVSMGGLIERLQSYLPGAKEPDNAGPKGTAFTPGGRGVARKWIATMKTKLGATYVWGGNTPSEGGFDCSGIGYWAAQKLGLKNIPRVSADQIAHARPLSVDKALRTVGACVYQPGHIAYSLGNGKDVLEASGSRDKVVIQDGRGRFTQGGIFPEFLTGGGAKPKRSQRRTTRTRQQV